MIDLDVMQGYIRDANPIPSLDDVDADELAAFVAAAHTRRAAIMQAPTQQPTVTSPVTPPAQRRRRVWAFAAAFILIVVAVGIAALVAGGGRDAPVTDEPMAPTDVESLTWSRVPHDDAVFNPTTGIDMMWSITRGGPGFVAVGRTLIRDDGRDPIPWELDLAYWQNLGPHNLLEDGLRNLGEPALWISEDGLSWSRLPDIALSGSDGGGVIESVIAGGPGLVAVGADISEYPSRSPGLAVPLNMQRALGKWAWYGAVWTSEDGLVWSSVELAEPDNRLGWLNDVTAGGPGLVAVGSGNVPGGEPKEGQTHARTAAVWTSTDGTTWTRVPHDPDVFGSGIHDGSGSGWSMEAVTVGGPGLVAVGTAPDGPAAWTSPDGLTWTLVPRTDLPGEGQMLDVVVGGPGLVAIGADQGWGGAASVWMSPDGFTWTVVSRPDLPDSEEQLRSVTSVGSELVAVGRGVWTSVDGATWSRAEIPNEGDIHSVARTEDGLIAVGIGGYDCMTDTDDEETGACAAAVWIATNE